MDFLIFVKNYFVTVSGSYECIRGFRTVMHIAQLRNIPFKQSKTIHPTTCYVLHGIEVDILRMTAKLPGDKSLKA